MLRDMTEGKPLRLMINFSIPLVFANILQMLYVLVNGAIVGRMLGVRAFASLGSTVSIHWLLLSVVIGITYGFGTIFGQQYGAKDMAGLRRSFATSIYLSLLFSVLIGIAGAFGSRGMLVLLNTPLELLDGATIYLKVMLIGMPITFILNLLFAKLRALGDSKTPFRAIILSSFLNIALDFALVIPFGLRGIAVATLLAQAVGGIYCAITLHKSGIFRGMSYKPDTTQAIALLRLGLPIGLRNAVIDIGGLIVQRYVNGYGMEFVAGVTVAKRMYSLLLIAGFAIEATVVTFVAQNYGAGKFERIKQGVSCGLKMVLISVTGIMVFAMFCGRWIMSLLIEGSEAQMAHVFEIGVKQLIVIVAGLPLLYLALLYRAAIQGMGKPLIPVLAGISEMLLRTFLMIFMISIWDEWGVLLADPIGWLPAALMLGLSFKVIYRQVLKRQEFTAV